MSKNPLRLEPDDLARCFCGTFDILEEKRLESMDCRPLTSEEISAMEAEYRDTIGIRTPILGSIRKQRLEDLCRSRNRFAHRRMADCHLRSGDLEYARYELLYAVMYGDLESAERAFTDRRLWASRCGNDCIRDLSRIFHFASIACEGFEDLVKRLLEEGDPETVEMLYLASDGHFAEGMLRKVEPKLLKGRSERLIIDSLSESVTKLKGCYTYTDPLECYANSWARSETHTESECMMLLLYVGVYLDRDERRVRRWAEKTQISPWTRFFRRPSIRERVEKRLLPDGPYVTDRAMMTWEVLLKVTCTATTGHTSFADLANEQGAFENDVFAFLPQGTREYEAAQGPVILHKPSGTLLYLQRTMTVEKDLGGRCGRTFEVSGVGSMNGDVRVRSILWMLEKCLRSARDTIHGYSETRFQQKIEMMEESLTADD